MGLFDDVLQGGGQKGLFDDVLTPAPKKAAPVQQGYDVGEQALLDALGYNDAPTKQGAVAKFLTETLPESARKTAIGMVQAPIEMGKKAISGDFKGLFDDVLREPVR